MSSTKKEYRDYVVEQLFLVDNLMCRPMMGGYLFYSNNKLFGGLYNNRFLIKITDGGKKFALKEDIPYKGAKMMYLIDDFDQELLKEIVNETCKCLPNK